MSIGKGFVLNDAAIYSFEDQDVYDDIVSFAAAIPYNLRPLFLIPIEVEIEYEDNPPSGVASTKVASDAADLFSYRTLVTDEDANSKGVSNGISSPDTTEVDYPVYESLDGDFGTNDDGPLFNRSIDLDLDGRQWGPNTGYMSDVDITETYDEGYPYRSKNLPSGYVHHSSILPVYIVKLAAGAMDFAERTNIRQKKYSEWCLPKIRSYDLALHTMTFNVKCSNSNKSHEVIVALNPNNEVAVRCDCEFWRYSGPDYHAAIIGYLYGKQRSNGLQPKIRDKEHNNYLCKHSYSVLKILDDTITSVMKQYKDNGIDYEKNFNNAFRDIINGVYNNKKEVSQEPFRWDSRSTSIRYSEKTLERVLSAVSMYEEANDKDIITKFNNLMKLKGVEIFSGISDARLDTAVRAFQKMSQIMNNLIKGIEYVESKYEEINKMAEKGQKVMPTQFYEYDMYREKAVELKDILKGRIEVADEIIKILKYMKGMKPGDYVRQGLMEEYLEKVKQYDDSIGSMSEFSDSLNDDGLYGSEDMEENTDPSTGVEIDEEEIDNDVVELVEDANEEIEQDSDIDEISDMLEDFEFEDEDEI